MREAHQMSKSNQTTLDAYNLVLEARLGFLNNDPSDRFLLQLRNELYLWIDQVTDELARREIKRQRDEQAKFV
jgi:hypothetical protein